jgi:hypothetical protein
LDSTAAPTYAAASSPRGRQVRPAPRQRQTSPTVSRIPQQDPDEHGGIAEVGDDPHERGEPGLAVSDEEPLDWGVDQGELIVGDHVLEQGAERPAGRDEHDDVRGQGQAQRAAWLQPAGEEGELALVAAAEPPHPGTVELAVGERANAVGVVGDPTGSQHDSGYDHGDEEQDQAGAPGGPLDLAPATAGGVAE